MKYLLVAILCLAFWPFQSATAADMPDYLRKLELPYRSGDWVLQCDSSRMCQIMGVSRTSGRKSDMRAIVTLSRGIEKHAKFYVRFAFVDNEGVANTTPSPTMRIHSRGLFNVHAPMPLALGNAEGERDYPHYRSETGQGLKIIRALQRWPRTVLKDQGKHVSRMPQGNLGWLIRKMTKLQHPGPDVMTKAEEAEWMNEYHYRFVRAKRANDVSAPDNVVLACNTTAGIEAWHLDSFNTLWLSHCATGPSIFLRRDGDDPLVFNMRDIKGEIQAQSSARFDQNSSTLELGLSKKEGRGDCGRRVRFVFTDQQEFGILEDRRYDLCRGVPPAYWPIVWSPTTWKFIE